jgi:O-methyltransferase involved in polyketide biosynthesis
MARADEDTWDLAASVGATATIVAVGRALASRSPNALIHDPFAEPLVQAVGVPFFARIVNGELDPADADGGAGYGLTRMTRMMLSAPGSSTTFSPTRALRASDR